MDNGFLQIYMESLESLKKTHISFNSEVVNFLDNAKLKVESENQLTLETLDKKLKFNMKNVKFNNKDALISISKLEHSSNASLSSVVDVTSEVFDDSIDYLLTNGESIICRRCHLALLNLKYFTSERVPFITDENKPMHSNEEFFCECSHSDQNVRRKTNDEKVELNSKFLKYNPLQLIISSKLIKKLPIKSERGILYCNHCLSVLGTEDIESNHCILLVNRVFIILTEEDDDSCCNGKHTEAAFLSDHEYLHELCKNFIKADIHRIIIFSSNSSSVHPYALLWLLDQRTLIHHASVDESDLQLSDETVLNVDSVYIERVLYRILTEQNDADIDDKSKSLLKEWTRDFSVEHIVLPIESCIALSSLLTQITLMIAPNNRFNDADDKNGFLIGGIPSSKRFDAH